MYFIVVLLGSGGWFPPMRRSGASRMDSRTRVSFDLLLRVPGLVAEGVGFEPTGLVGQGFSRPSHSSALPSLPGRGYRPVAGRLQRCIWERSPAIQASASCQAASARRRTSSPPDPAV